MKGQLNLAVAAIAASFASSITFADPDPEMIEPVSRFVGEMDAPMPEDGVEIADVDNTLRFEPIQNFAEMFLRDDVVFLMRHGPTDWDKLDQPDVSPTDCENQRILSEQGRKDMRDLGALFAFNDISFGKIYVSEWCRNQQTLEEISAGYESVEPGIFDQIPRETYAQANLLLSLQGAPHVTDLRELIAGWDGGDGAGPLLVISHFTNIQELTQFSVYEGEALVLDPDRDNRVLGYVRLRTASPDVGHFEVVDQDEVNREAASRGSDG